eukprot:2196990-Rhodomonas_salina.7
MLRCRRCDSSSTSWYRFKTLRQYRYSTWTYKKLRQYWKIHRSKAPHQYRASRSARVGYSGVWYLAEFLGVLLLCVLHLVAA